MGQYLALTKSGERLRDRWERARRLPNVGLSDELFVLLEVGRNQPAEEEHFLLHMEDNGFPQGKALDILDSLESSGYIVR